MRSKIDESNACKTEIKNDESNARKTDENTSVCFTVGISWIV